MASSRTLLASLTVAWTIVWVQRAVVGPVGPLLRDELGIDYALLGLLPTLGLVGGAIGYLAGGRWATRSLRGCTLAGLALLGASTLAAALAGDYPTLAGALLVQGFAEGLFYVPALAIVTRAYPKEGAGRALGILDSGISLGSVMAFAAAPLLAELLMGWRGPFLVAGALGLAVLPIAALAVPRGSQELRVAAPMRAVLEWRHAPAYAAIVLLIVSYFAVLYLAPAFLLTRGFDLPTADGLTAFALILGVPWHVLGGHWADRHGPARVAAVFATLQGLLTIALAFPLSPLPTAALLVASYSLSIAAFVALMALVQRIFGHELAAPAFGVFWSVGYLGGSVGPLLMGAIADRAGFGPALALLGAFAIATALVLIPTARREGRPGRD